MPELSVLLLAACMFLGAALYTSVGHAGASAYIALMALFGVAPVVMAILPSWPAPRRRSIANHFATEPDV